MLQDEVQLLMCAAVSPRVTAALGILCQFWKGHVLSVVGHMIDYQKRPESLH